MWVFGVWRDAEAQLGSPLAQFFGVKVGFFPIPVWVEVDLDIVARLLDLSPEAVFLGFIPPLGDAGEGVLLAGTAQVLILPHSPCSVVRKIACFFLQFPETSCPGKVNLGIVAPCSESR